MTAMETGMSLLFGGQISFGVAEHVAVGGVLSIEMPLMVAEASFPARSRNVRVADWLVPSLVKRTCWLAAPSSPESASVAVKVAVTSVLTQPSAFASGLRVAVTLGAVLSIRTSRVFGD